MLVQLLTVIAILGNLHGKPIIIRNISDCSITENGILHYQGKHSFTKFEHECLLWTDLQTFHPEIINEPNFFNDPSIKAAKNYCRNPNMNINGPWCYVQDEGTISMEGCNVCQSLSLRSTLPTDIGAFDDDTVVPENNGFFQNVRDEILRYGAYVRQKVTQIVNHMKDKMSQLKANIYGRFDF